jgi:hypothetical protein
VDIAYGEGFNANGIDSLRGGHTLVIVQSNTGKLFRVNPRNGRTREIALDRPVTNATGSSAAAGRSTSSATRTTRSRS